MPHRQKVQRAEIRAVLLRMMVDIFRAYYVGQFKTEKFGADADIAFILSAVVIGQTEGQLMTATDIANYLGMARPTVARKLQQHAHRVRTVRTGKRVCYLMEKPNAPDVLKAVETVLGVIRRSNRQLSKMVYIGIDQKAAKP